MVSVTLFYPLFAFVALPATILMLLALLRLRAMKLGLIDEHYIEKQQESLAPETVVKLTHNLANLFEFPVLFIVACLLCMFFKLEDNLYVGLAWAYVVSRYIHSLIHISYNKVAHRFSVFLTGCLILILFWFRLLFHMSTLS